MQGSCFICSNFKKHIKNVTSKLESQPLIPVMSAFCKSFMYTLDYDLLETYTFILCHLRRKIVIELCRGKQSPNVYGLNNIF